ncbi:DNA cytosine methyltransferase [Pseudoclavibacter helvolus]|uniref:DNA cytosine methyltransferase n=1 Tax=Pseudoclavibacter helvolus TaxID=255205 RepID=UPI003C7239A2
MTPWTIGGGFEGYGGLTLGVSRALARFGIKTKLIWYSEFDPNPSRIMAHNYPGIPNLGDITQIDWSTVARPTVFTAGFPCQDLSLAGRRAGMRPGTRSGLWSDTLNAIKQLQPRLVVIENVRGLLSGCAESDLEPCPGCVGDGDHRPVLRALGRVLGDLADLGFDAEWGGIEASAVGAPHRRFRVFVVAWKQGTLPELASELGRSFTESPLLMEPPALFRTPMADEDGGGPLHPDTARERGQTLRLTGQVLAMTGDLLPTPSASVANDGEGTETWLARREQVKAKGINGNGMGMPLSIAVQLLPTPDAYAGSRGGSQDPDKRRAGGHTVSLQDVTEQKPEAFGDYQPAINRWQSVIGRPAPSPTSQSVKGKPQLDPPFVEFLMGLDAGWVTSPGIWDDMDMTAPAVRNAKLKALGNGVVPQQAAEAVTRLLDRAFDSLAA